MPTYYDYRRVYLPQEESQDMVIALIVVAFTIMAFNISSPEVVFLVALCILMLSEVLSINDVLSGFSNESLVAIGSLFIVIGAMEKSHFVDYISRVTFGRKSSPFVGTVRMYVSAFFISAWFNNIPQVSIMIPVIKDWAILKNIPASQLMMPLSYTVLAGGMLATIGTSTNLQVQGLLSSNGLEQFNFFDPAVVGLPAGILVIIYMLVAAPYLLPWHENKRSPEHQRAYLNIVEIEFEQTSSYIGQTPTEFLADVGIELDQVVKLVRPSAQSSSLERSKSISGKAARLVVATGDGSIEKGEDGEGKHDNDFDETDFNTNRRNYNFKSTKAMELPFFQKQFWSYVPQFIKDGIHYAIDLLPAFFQVPEGYDKVEEHYYDDTNHTEILGSLCYNEQLQPNDKLYVANAQVAVHKTLKMMVWQRQGIKFLGGLEIIDLPQYGNLLVECVLSKRSPFIGLTLAEVCHDINDKYASAIISARSHNDCDTNEEALQKRPSSLHLRFEVGDSIIVVTDKKNYKNMLYGEDFASVIKLEELPVVSLLWHLFPTITFLTVVSLVAAEQVEMCPAALSMAAFFFVFGWLEPSDIEKYVELRLLMLMGCSISFAVSMSKTGLSVRIAEAIYEGVSDPFNSLFLIYIATLLITELISNNAAAALVYPIAISFARIEDLNYKPFAMTVMQAATMAFMCPIGYATHLMVWAPGNYTFFDFLRFGAIPNAIWMITTCLIVPAVWPFSDDASAN